MSNALNGSQPPKTFMGSRLMLAFVLIIGGLLLAIHVLGDKRQLSSSTTALNKNAMLDAGLPRDTDMEDGVDEQGDGGGDDDWHYAGDTAPDKCADIVPDVGGDGIGEPP